MDYPSNTNLSHEQQSAIDAMIALHVERHSGKQLHIVEEFPDLQTMPRTYLGAFVWTNNKNRYMKSVHARTVGDLQMSPADVAREYLHYRYDGQTRRTSTRAYCKCFKPHHKSIPLYAVPHTGDLVYLDLKSAYWTILRTVGWDVDYSPERFVGVRSSNEDFPFPNDKLARNILVSAGLPSRSQVWTGKRIISVKSRNPLYNGILWCFVQDVLNTIAWQMVGAGALYVHTDGYIFRQRDEGIAYDIAHAWGVKLGVKYRGRGEIFGVSNYWIEGKKFRRPRSNSLLEHVNINPVENADFLRTRFRHWREVRNLI